MNDIFEPTEEMRERHLTWVMDYSDAVVDQLAIDGALDAGSDHAARLRVAIAEDMKVSSRPDWMHPTEALAIIVAAPSERITDPELRLQYQDATRTLSSQSRHQRLRTIADAMGVTVDSARQYDLQNPVLPNLNLSGRTALYRHFDDQGVLLYVGIAKDPDQRFALHKVTSLWTEWSVDMSVEWYDTRVDALQAERVAIAGERPLFNMRGSVRDSEDAGDYVLFRSLSNSST